MQIPPVDVLAHIKAVLDADSAAIAADVSTETAKAVDLNSQLKVVSDSLAADAGQQSAIDKFQTLLQSLMPPPSTTG